MVIAFLFKGTVIGCAIWGGLHLLCGLPVIALLVAPSFGCAMCLVGMMVSDTLRRSTGSGHSPRREN